MDDSETYAEISAKVFGGDEHPLLTTAIAVWEEGDEINLIHEAKLMALGYDVASLRNQFRA